MSDLSGKQRQGLRAAQFALPKTRSASHKSGGWPIPDKSHARFALTQVGRSEAKGNISAGQAATIRARANAKLGKSK